MKILIVQAKPKVGDLDHNFNKIREYYRLASTLGANLVLFPELFTVGYLPGDLILKNSFLYDLQKKISELANFIDNVTAVIPTIVFENNKLYNGVIALKNGVQVGFTTKTYLPNYGIFDEKRYFVPGIPKILNIDNVKIGIPVCEDIWFSEVSRALKANGAELLLVPNASPYEIGKPQRREFLVKTRYNETKLPIVYCNQVLGHDGVIYDGRSFTYDGDELNYLSPQSEESMLVEFKSGKFTVLKRLDENDIELKNKSSDNLNINEEMYGAIVAGVRDFIIDNNAEKVIVGLSGGIDSALVSVIAADAIGANNVKAIIMPSDFNSKESMDDALQLIKNLGISHEIVPITEIYNVMKSKISDLSQTAEENLQARIRGTILMSISNSSGEFLLTTGNKSELAFGYCTLYGDMCGAFNPIKDIYKTQVYDLAKLRNKLLPRAVKTLCDVLSPIPENIITKAPTAELRPNQKDSDSLPDYDLMDRVLNLYVEQDLGLEEIIELGVDREIAEKIIKMVNFAEFKRSQSAPGVKISPRDFTSDRRYPITLGYKG